MKWWEDLKGSEGFYYSEMVVLLFYSVIYVTFVLCLCILVVIYVLLCVFSFIVLFCVLLVCKCV